MENSILVFQDLVSKAEAQEIIKRLDQYPLMHEPVETSNSIYSRIYYHNSDLSQRIWDRIKDKVIEHFDCYPNLAQVRPVWSATKYIEEGHLGVHMDGYSRGRGWRSRLTINLYLNDNFNGGSTRFYKDDSGDQESVIKEVFPKIGTAVVFPQDLYHSGEPIVEGTKYILRSDINEPDLDSRRDIGNKGEELSISISL